MTCVVCGAVLVSGSPVVEDIWNIWRDGQLVVESRFTCVDCDRLYTKKDDE